MKHGTALGSTDRHNGCHGNVDSSQLVDVQSDPWPVPWLSRVYHGWSRSDFRLDVQGADPEGQASRPGWLRCADQSAGPRPGAGALASCIRQLRKNLIFDRS